MGVGEFHQGRVPGKRRRPSPLMGEGSLPALMVLTRPPPPIGSPWYQTLQQQKEKEGTSAPAGAKLAERGGQNEAVAAEAWRRSQLDPGLLGWRSPSPRLAGSPPLATKTLGVGRVKHHLSHRGAPSLERLKESLFLVQVRWHDGATIMDTWKTLCDNMIQRKCGSFFRYNFDACVAYTCISPFFHFVSFTDPLCGPRTLHRNVSSLFRRGLRWIGGLARRHAS